MIERRRGGETGIVAVQALRGGAIRRAFQEQPWVKSLFESALAKLPPRATLKSDWITQKDAALFLLEHHDGLKSAIAMTGSMTTEFAFAARVKTNPAPVSTWVHLPDKPPFGHFAHLLKAIEETIHSGRAVFPIERTLLTTGTLDRLLHSVAQNGRRFDTPELAIAYQPSDWPYANHPKAPLDLPMPRKVHQ